MIFDFIKHQSDHCLALYVSPSSCWICWIHATSSWVSKSSKAVSFDPIRTCHTCYTNFSPFTKQDQNEVWPRFSLIALKEFNEVLKDSMPWVRCAFVRLLIKIAKVQNCGFYKSACAKFRRLLWDKLKCICKIFSNFFGKYWTGRALQIECIREEIGFPELTREIFNMFCAQRKKGCQW